MTLAARNAAAFVPGAAFLQPRHRALQITAAKNSLPLAARKRRTPCAAPKCGGIATMSASAEGIRREAKTGERMRDLEIHVHEDKTSVVFDYTPGKKDIPTVVYLPGFFYARTKTAKPTSLALQCKRKQQGFIVLDYSGTDRSGGDFAHGTVSRWVAEVEAVLDAALERSREKVVLVGSGIGGWIMLHVAQRRPDQVVGLVGLSADPDFTEKLLRPTLSEEQQSTLDKPEGEIELKWGYRTYPIHHALVEDGKKMLVLNGRDSIPVKCPVRLVVGMADEEVPSSLALELVDALQSRDVALEFVKIGDHALEREEDFRLMWRYVCEVSDKYFEFDLGSPASG